MMRSRRKLLNWLVMAALLVFASPLFAPQLLAFSYHAKSGDFSVYSEAPIDRSKLDAVTGRAAALVSTSPFARPSEPRRVFLTTGGWRWNWLALRFRDSFAVSRPFSEPLIFNRSDVSRDRVYAGDTDGAVRSLSGTIAHESCHGLLRREVGLRADWTTPGWLREGYCDFIANESALNARQVEQLRATDPDHRAVIYFDGRRRVAAELSRNGGDAHALFDAH